MDAPVTYGMELEEFKEYYKSEYGENGMKELGDRLNRVHKNGSSGHPPYDDINDFFKYNRAGENETTISKSEIILRYCRECKG